MNNRNDIINQIQDGLGSGGSRQDAESVYEHLRSDGRIAYTDAAGLVIADGVDLIEVADSLLQRAPNNPFAVAQARSRERVAAHKAEKAAAFAADLAAAAEKGPDHYAAFRAEAIAIISAHREVPGSASDADLVDLIRSI